MSKLQLPLQSMNNIQGQEHKRGGPWKQSVPKPSLQLAKPSDVLLLYKMLRFAFHYLHELNISNAGIISRSSAQYTSQKRKKKKNSLKDKLSDTSLIHILKA